MSKDDTIRTIVKENAALYRAVEEAQDKLAEEKSKDVVRVIDVRTLDPESLARAKELNAASKRKKRK